MVDPLIVVQVVAGSNPVSHPICNPHANRGSSESGTHEGFSLPTRSPATSDVTGMLRFMRYIRKYSNVRPRTFWCEFSFFTVMTNARQKFCLGTRPEDLAHIDTIDKRSWERHAAYLERLEKFPLDKAEYYIRMKETYGVNTVRGLAEITGEDWSAIAKLIRTLDLVDPIKDFLRNNKNDPGIVQFFHLRRLLEIVRQGDEREQLIRFREMIQECEDGIDFGLKST